MPSTTTPPGLGERFGSHMSPSDAVLWDVEVDPVLRSTITAVALLDRVPDWDRLVRRIDHASRIIPRLRQRAVEPTPRLGPPRWVVDPEFDLEYHLRRTRVPEPGTMRALLDMIQPLSLTAFDRFRPLWEFTLVDGLEDGRAAFVQKLHHTLTDGVGAVELAMAMLDDRRDAAEPDMVPEPEPGRADAVAVTGAATWDLARGATGSAVAAARFGLGTALGLARHPIVRSRRTAAVAASIARLLAPVPRSASPILGERSLRRRFATLDLPLADLKGAGHEAGCTANDALLAAVVDGVRRYHACHGVELEELRLTMPVNLRHEGDDPGGNHFAPVRFAVPADIADPVERMQRLGSIARTWRSEPALELSNGLAVALDLLPHVVTAGAFGAMLKHVDAVVTNIPGIVQPAFLAGAALEREYAFAPPIGAALNVSLLSHLGTACVGIVCDSAAIPDWHLLTSCIAEGFDDIGVAP